MQREKLGGGTMIVGAIAGVVTMVFHPRGSDIARDVAGAGALSAVVHGLALLATPLTFFGLCVLTSQLARRSALAQLALVFQGAAAIAVMLAASLNGFIATTLIARLAVAADPNREIVKAMLRYNGDVGQFFARAYLLGSAIAIGLWSVEMLRTRMVLPGAGYLGVTTSLVTLVGVASGWLPMTIHGFGAVMLAEGVWLVMAGTWLLGVESSG